ncbi:hypothetical protein E2C01_093908 [Portunus trituberculatus]|uniref:Uncharacterized protein n=1 Tax=Portunus trituberculatus TaxID=210409 RepID=A0A5B7JVH6_PORTR|nr:hypothetical protein [Portunus trituberculatus]
MSNTTATSTYSPLPTPLEELWCVAWCGAVVVVVACKCWVQPDCYVLFLITLGFIAVLASLFCFSTS